MGQGAGNHEDVVGGIGYQRSDMIKETLGDSTDLRERSV